MRLKDFLQVANDQTISIWERTGGSSISHIFTKDLCNQTIPEELLEREICTVSASPMEQFGRPSACFQVTIYGGR